LIGRRPCGADETGLRATTVGGLAVPSAEAAACGGAGSALMMLTGGMEADDGK
jgi:hypothetical protein